MTAAEAKDILDRCVVGDCELCNNNKKHFGSCDGSDYAFSAIAEAQKALDKQIPKKPTNFAIDNNNGYTIYDCECPTCEQSYRELFPFGFCIHCGQKIDWGDIK